MTKYYAGLDIGTSGAKVVVLSGNGEVAAAFRSAYGIAAHPDPRARELALSDVLRGVGDCLRALRAGEWSDRLEGITLSTAMHSLIGMDEHFRPVTEILTWADLRSAAVFRDLQKEAFARRLPAHTGTPLHPMSPFFKIYWLKNSKAPAHRRIRYFADLKSYLLYRLTGVWRLDHSLASATGLWDAEGRSWGEEILERLGIRADQLPDLCDTHESFPAAADEWLPRGLPVVAGASDGCLSNFATTLGEQGGANLTLGTSGALRVNRPKYVRRSVPHLFCYYLSEEEWILGGATNNAGNVADLAVDAFPELSIAVDRPVFVPYHFGERSPVVLLESRSGFAAPRPLGESEKARLIVRSLIFNVDWIRSQLERETDSPLSHITLTGGLAEKPGLPQLIADVFDCTVSTPAVVDSSALGAALFGARSLGAGPSLVQGQAPRYAPDPDRQVVYREEARYFRAIVSRFHQNPT